MTEFFEAVGSNALSRNALLMALLASFACGTVGTYVVARRISYIAAGIAHCVLGGLGMAEYVRVVHGVQWLKPLHGALIAALVAAGIIAWSTLRAREREDTAIGAVWAIGMAMGILFITRTPGYVTELEGYLFGNIMMVAPGDLWMVAALDGVLAVVLVLWYPQIQAVCFDEEFARLRNVPVVRYYLLLLALVAVTVVLLVSVVGIVLVVALLTLPVAIAGRFSNTLLRMMLLATLFCAGLSVAGLAVSYPHDLPPGPTIIMLSGAAYLAVSTLRPSKRGPVLPAVAPPT